VVSSCGVPPLTRGWVCNLLVQVLLGLATAVPFGSKSHRTCDRLLWSHLRLDSLFVASYDLQDYNGSILLCLHTGITVSWRLWFRILVSLRRSWYWWCMVEAFLWKLWIIPLRMLRMVKIEAQILASEGGFSVDFGDHCHLFILWT
jgi:hypothetical protein